MATAGIPGSGSGSAGIWASSTVSGWTSDVPASDVTAVFPTALWAGRVGALANIQIVLYSIQRKSYHTYRTLYISYYLVRGR